MPHEKHEKHDEVIVLTKGITVLTDVNIATDPETDELFLFKTFTRYHFHVRDGHVEIQIMDTFTKEEDVVIPNGYGYGSTASLPDRKSTAHKPNFYTK